MNNGNDIGVFDPAGMKKNPINDKEYSDKYKQLGKIWSTFPAYQKAEEIIDSIKNNQITFIISGTGSGKTVLIPKFALHYTNYNGKIGITLPKRQVTLSAASFAADTFDAELGKEIGYAYKGSPSSANNSSNKILYMTDGMLVMYFVRDPYLSDFNVIIIDEAHERKAQIDFLMLFIKDLLLSGKRPDLRVIIMSATIDGPKYKQYFSGATSKIINISGQPNHEITTHFLEKPSYSYMTDGYNIIENLINKGIRKDMLFFITTSNEAVQLCKTIRPKFSDVYCIEVYSDMDSNLRIYAQSSDKFLELGNYKQKLVMATNVAESSLTIDGLKYVIDSGYEFYSYYDPNVFGQIYKKKLITKAQALQRRGRVGRTEPGVCYHLLTEKQFNELDDFPAPDILKQDVTIDFLRIINMSAEKTYDSGLKMLNSLMDPPKKTYINSAKKLFDIYKLVDEKGVITNISNNILQFTALPLNRCLFLIYAYQLHCVKQAAIIVAAIEHTKGKLINFFYKTDTVCNSSCKQVSIELVKKVSSKKGDHLSFLALYNECKKNKGDVEWFKKHGLKQDIIKKIDNTFRTYYSKAFKMSKDVPQLSRAENIDVNKNLLKALKLSHEHLTAKNLEPVLSLSSGDNISGQISKDSVLHYFHKVKDLRSKKIIYDELANVSDNWEFNVVTII